MLLRRRPQVRSSCCLKNNIKVHLLAPQGSFYHLLSSLGASGSLCQRDECEVLIPGIVPRLRESNWPRASTALVRSCDEGGLVRSVQNEIVPQQSSVQPCSRVAISVCLPRDMRKRVTLIGCWEEQQSYFR